MYELVKGILDISRDRDVDVSVAYDMYAQENGGYTDEVKDARKVIEKHYFTIAKCRRAGDNESIRKLCDLVAEGDVNAIRDFVEEIEKR